MRIPNAMIRTFALFAARRFGLDAPRTGYFLAAFGLLGAVIQGAMIRPIVRRLGDKRTFKVCSKSDCTTLDTVGAVVKTVGAHIAIYVDTLAPSPQLSQTALDSIAAVFDARLYPLDTVTFGGVSDIDGNSVVIVLMTRTVNKLVPKNQCNGGFIAGFFFSGDLDPTFAAQFNNGEIFYSLVADAAGTLSCPHSTSQLEMTVPVTFVHEFQHMINFVQKVRIRGGQSENTWLDDVHMVPLDHIEIPKAEAVQPVQDLIAEALKNRLEIERGKLNIESQKIMVIGNKNALLPNLQAFAEFTNHGLSGPANPLYSNCCGAPLRGTLRPSMDYWIAIVRRWAAWWTCGWTRS